MRTLLTLAQLCEALSLSSTTVYKLIRSGRFPAPIRVGKLSRWSSRDVDQWIADRETERRSAAPCPHLRTVESRRSA